MRFAWLLVIAGCGGGGDKHWRDQPLTSFEGKVGGRAYTIELPSGAKNTALNDGQNVFDPPFVSIQWFERKKTLAEDKGKDDVILHEEQRADGHVYARTHRDGYQVFAQKYAADGAFVCSTSIYPIKDQTLEDLKPLVPKLEAMCSSIKPK
jgi:hypothetical protein